MNQDWIKVKMFRTVEDLSIDSKARKAHFMPDPDLAGWSAWFHVPTGSVHVKTNKGRQGIVGAGNLSFTETYGESYGPFQTEGREPKEETETQKRGPGRPKLTT